MKQTSYKNVMFLLMIMSILHPKFKQADMMLEMQPGVSVFLKQQCPTLENAQDKGHNLHSQLDLVGK